MLVKICGLRDEEHIRVAVEAGADAVQPIAFPHNQHAGAEVGQNNIREKSYFDPIQESVCTTSPTGQ